jgi:hypothetical protein
MPKRLTRVFPTMLALALTNAEIALAQSETSVEAQGQAAAAVETAATPLTLAAGTTLAAALETKLDARHAKVDDTVAARVTKSVEAQGDAAVTVPRGSKLLGRITQVDDSRLGVVFDRVVLPDGRELAAALELQALAAAEVHEDPVDTSATARARASSGAGARGGLLGGAAGAVGAASDVVTGTTGSLGARADAAVEGASRIDAGLASSTVGVVGMKGLALEAQGSSSTVVSTRGPVVLHGGTRLLLRGRAAAN